MKGVYQVKYWELVEERKGERPVGGGADGCECVGKFRRKRFVHKLPEVK